MRLPSLLLLIASLTGCLSTTSAAKRVALAPSPGAPPQLRGSAGVGLAARIAVTGPTSGPTGGGVATPPLQPELNGVFKFGEHAYGSFDLLFIPGPNAHAARVDAPRVTADLSVGGLLGFGYDFQILDEGGFQAAVEGGMSSISVSTAAGGVALGDHVFQLPMGRVSLAPYFERGGLRLFLAGTLGTDVWSEPDAVATTCTGCGGFSDTGRTEVRPVGMAGGGVRYRPNPMFSVGAEVWLPITTAGVQHGPQLTLAVQVGNFDFSRSKRAAPPLEEVVSPPPPPPRI